MIQQILKTLRAMVTVNNKVYTDVAEAEEKIVSIYLTKKCQE